eukprot:CAMPEP_0119570638 /NCGR_PEP_ID=MMETSP1352-20130426/43713_1 /TAXON_ID=265584 /ORGANISM="Stauroneis constricta, Strain CCMP1120" /LENGTH=469 /DNA_ID=CAMNT_0007620307 /DNA_START=205 /DNA_END=1614 /DNA_ORIENTATION=-
MPASAHGVKTTVRVLLTRLAVQQVRRAVLHRVLLAHLFAVVVTVVIVTVFVVVIDAITSTSFGSAVSLPPAPILAIAVAFPLAVDIVLLTAILPVVIAIPVPDRRPLPRQDQLQGVVARHHLRRPTVMQTHDDHLLRLEGPAVGGVPDQRQHHVVVAVVVVAVVAVDMIVVIATFINADPAPNERRGVDAEPRSRRLQHQLAVVQPDVQTHDDHLLRLEGPAVGGVPDQRQHHVVVAVVVTMIIIAMIVVSAMFINAHTTPNERRRVDAEPRGRRLQHQLAVVQPDGVLAPVLLQHDVDEAVQVQVALLHLEGGLVAFDHDHAGFRDVHVVSLLHGHQLAHVDHLHGADLDDGRVLVVAVAVAVVVVKVVPMTMAIAVVRGWLGVWLQNDRAERPLLVAVVVDCCRGLFIVAIVSIADATSVAPSVAAVAQPDGSSDVQLAAQKQRQRQQQSGCGHGSAVALGWDCVQP